MSSGVHHRLDGRLATGPELEGAGTLIDQHAKPIECCIPVIASGGVACGTDVAEFMLAGATAVQVGTASFVREPEEILSEFSDYLDRMGTTASELTGAL